MESASKESIQFRRATPSDMGKDVAWLTSEAWPMPEKIGPASDASSLVSAYVEQAVAQSDWLELACVSGEVVGVLFGRIVGRGQTTVGWMTHALKIVGKTLLRGYGRLDRPVAVLWRFLLTELKVAINRPRSGAEITLLIVSSKHRRKGVGRGLVERFVKAASEQGCHLVYVYTDDVTSDYEFYLESGFSKYSTFIDHWSSYYSGERSMGIVYCLELKPPARH